VIEALVGFAIIFALALLRVPLAFAMAAVGVGGMGLLRGWEPALASTAQVVYETGFAYTLSVIPLFILMGNFVARAGLASELFQAAYAFIGHKRGGLAHATVVACAGFGAICGSSIATAATMGKVAYPSMKRLGYSDALSMGVIAAGGTLGIMIPPSTIMVIYGIITETNIGKLFAAGVLPGLLTAVLMMLGIGLYAPCMILVSILGMNLQAAFPIMMGSCAFLMPVATGNFIKLKAVDMKAVLGLMIGGIPGVLVSAYIVKSLNVEWLKWLVVVVVTYTATSMLVAARRERTKAGEAPVAAH